MIGVMGAGLFVLVQKVNDMKQSSAVDMVKTDVVELSRTIAGLQQTMGDLTAAAADVLHTESKVCSANDLRRVLHEANEAMAAITALVNVVASRVPAKKDAA
jgi:hypothetical protein